MEFGYKIRFAVTVNCFVYVCTYACCRAKQLFGNGGIFFRFGKIFIKQYDLSCKIKGFIK